MLACNISAHSWDNASCLLGSHTPQGTIPHALLARDQRESRRHSGACSFKILPTTRNLFVGFLYQY